MMRVVVKEPGYRPVIKKIPPGLKDLQAVVGGYFETALKAPGYFGRDSLIVYCNEDGLRLQLPLNFHRSTDGHPIVGTVVALKHDEAGDTVSMTKTEAERARALLDAMCLPGDKETPCTP